ncbi:flagellin FliC [Ramlibacter sp. RBP-2]|uniref:Flagellin n=1 Tax=Ramlibacter lithotrophicus TaxID=2606681 RepID=A0A7X6DFD3_9BURK|nr:flagellin [Ramlibacter lithotrophicus]NKE66149.1 flagellin FliC [Ramlibacter lithotrophicus]
MTVINTNVLSLVTQQNMKSSQLSLNSAIQRLSSGMRINSAKDDAAGQAIANRFTANIRGLTQAQRNANDGISLAQTTEGALGEINGNLQRIRELAVQAANGSNSDSDLDSIQSEIDQRIAEINRTSEQTDFNGVKVLKDGVGSLTIQVGANDGETINIDLQAINADSLSITGFNVNGSGTVNTAATEADLLVGGFVAGATVNGTQQFDKTVNNTAATRANVFDAVANGNTVTYAGANTGYGAAATANTYTYASATDSYSFDVANVGAATVATKITPAAGGSTAATVTIGGSAQDVLINSSGVMTAADDGAALYLDATGNLTKNNAGADPAATASNVAAAVAAAAGDKIVVGGTTYTGDGATIDVTGASISATALEGATAGAAMSTNAGPGYAVAAGGAVTTGGATPVYMAAGALTTDATTVTSYFEQSNGVVTDGSGNKVYNDSASAGNFTLNARSGTTSTTNPLDVLDAALQQVDNLRGSLGAVQNRFDSVISNLGTTINNLKASRSRIEDADYATEVSNMSRAQILQQAGTSVLAQANQTTQGVLSLLR